MKLPKKVKDIFNNEPVHQLATSSKNGVPNISNAGAKYLLDDETIIIVDNYMNKTLSNIIENPAVAILLRSGKESYQIKGSCGYLTSGVLYEEAKKWMKSIGEKYPAKGVLKIKVEHIYNSNSGAGAGGKLKDPDK
jgi:predicted pyridoxine 5'-phosphate oxidase superfamily flavin-nucleotide-binding protein